MLVTKYSTTGLGLQLPISSGIFSSLFHLVAFAGTSHQAYSNLISLLRSTLEVCLSEKGPLTSVAGTEFYVENGFEISLFFLPASETSHAKEKRDQRDGS